MGSVCAGRQEATTRRGYAGKLLRFTNATGSSVIWTRTDALGVVEAGSAQKLRRPTRQRLDTVDTVMTRTDGYSRPIPLGQRLPKRSCNAQIVPARVKLRQGRDSSTLAAELLCRSRIND